MATRVVFVSPPASLREYTGGFARALGIAPRIRESMRKRLERRHGMRFDDIDRIEELEALNVRALFVHDREDRQVPIENSQRLRQRMPGARLLATHGLGHNRILREPSVVNAVADFVADDDAVPWELPALPRPAPIY
jgi:pimeloyl-ACP methyl ester carboxylesterase